MYLSLNWLKDYVEIPNTITPQNLSELLSVHVVEIDDVIDQSAKYNNIVVGKIVSIEEHPNADKLKKVVVDTASEKLDIICGASNIEVNQFVPVALVGSVLPDGLVIEKCKIRGEESNGMICSERELGIGRNHSGILVLDDTAKPGQALASFLDLNDFILEIDNKSLTNRPDLWGYKGLAREIALITGGKLKDSKEFVPTSSDGNTINIQVSNPDKCFRYISAQIDNIVVEDSPWDIKKKLIASGVRPISNIVDITNYAMLETGQPMHAFDKSLLTSSDSTALEIVVRQAAKDESIQTLDSQERALTEDDVVIANSSAPIAIAGIIGGHNTEINLETKSIVLESANFDSIVIRKTSQRLGLRTESSKRNEKGLDPNLAQTAMYRAIELIQKIYPNATLTGPIQDIKNYSHELAIINFDLNWLNQKIGTNIPQEKVESILKSLGFGTEVKKATEMSVQVPTWRLKDITIKEDLLEEIARIYGYNNIEPKMPELEVVKPKISPVYKLECALKKTLSLGHKLTEVSNYSFCSKKHLIKCNDGHENHIALANPLSEELTYLRQSLIPNILSTIKTNQASFNSVNIFEVGNIFLPIDSDLKKQEDSDELLPYQEKRLAIALASNSAQEGFAELKGIIENIGSINNIKISWQRETVLPGWCNPEESAQIIADEKEIGYVSIISKEVNAALNLKKQVVVSEIRLPELVQVINSSTGLVYRKDSKFPLATRDLSFVLNQKISYTEIVNELKSFHEYIKEVNLFDVYTGDQIKKDQKSMSFHICYQAEKSLVSEEVDEIQNKLIQKIETRFDAKIRDF